MVSGATWVLDPTKEGGGVYGGEGVGEGVGVDRGEGGGEGVGVDRGVDGGEDPRGDWSDNISISLRVAGGDICASAAASTSASASACRHPVSRPPSSQFTNYGFCSMLLLY